jgi:hypothetical protein
LARNELNPDFRETLLENQIDHGQEGLSPPRDAHTRILHLGISEHSELKLCIVGRELYIESKAYSVHSGEFHLDRNLEEVIEAFRLSFRFLPI